MGSSADRRKVFSIVLAVCLLVLFLGLGSMNAFNFKFISPQSATQILAFTGLSTVAFLLFVAVLVLLVRNVLKLYADQKTSVLGTRLRTRMLWGAVLVSLLPLAFMFAFSYGLMNRAVDRWFSQPVTEMRDDSSKMALDLSRYAITNARVEAESIAGSLPVDAPGPAGRESVRAATRGNTSGNSDRAGSREAGNRETGNREAIDRVLQSHENTLQGGFAEVFRDGRAVARFHVPQANGARAAVKPWVPERGSEEEGEVVGRARVETAHSEATDATILAAAQRSDEPIFSLGQNDYALATAGVKQGGTVVVGLPMPYGLSATMARMQSAADAYWTLFRGRREIRNLYMILLLMITSLALFAASWLALHFAKQFTKPVESLAEAMQAVAGGDYARRVAETATEELGELVRSFNHMAADLEGSRAQVEASTVQLSAANATLEARRSELETMLETIPNGVATLDEERRVVLANRALSELMDPGGQRPFLGRVMEDVFPAEVAEVLDRLIKRSHRMGYAASEMEMKGAEGTLFLLATVAMLEGGGPRSQPGSHRGYVLVLENATELLRAQKQSAWKEVARRVAHEIKNPLTPISLSAEQIHRHIDRLAAALAAAGGPESPSTSVIRRCSEVITASVESMRQLVDQFAALAEFPTARPRPADMNTIVENSLAVFAGRVQNIRVVTKLEPGLPLVMADPEALKRALGNLIDNAAEAMQHSLLRELRVTTCLLESGMLELCVADTGAGLTDEMKERLFLPYFSTKQRGTGLGLAIAAKIIQEHGGTIRAEKNVPAGARFIVELRAVASAESDMGSSRTKADGTAKPEGSGLAQPGRVSADETPAVAAIGGGAA